MGKRSLKNIIPTLLAVGASAVAGAGLCCALLAAGCFMDGDPGRYPVTFPVSVAGGVVCLGVFVLLAALYIRLRKKLPSLWLTVVDLLIGLGALLPFGFLWLELATQIM